MTQEKRASEQQDTGAAIPTRDYLLHRCPLCDSERVEYRFVAHGRVIAACADCGHLFANPQRF